MSHSPPAQGASAAPAKEGAAKVPELPSGMEGEAKLLQAFAEVPVVNKVHAWEMGGGGLWLTAVLSQRNLAANSQRKYTVHATLPHAAADGAPTVSPFPMEMPDVQVFSPCPKTPGVHLAFKGGNDTTSATLQLWRNGRMAWEVMVPKSLHGPLVNDGYFASGPAWSEDGSMVAYCAEVPAAEKTPAWSGPESLKDQAGPKSWRGVGPAVEDWGELNTGKRAPAVYVLHLASKQVLKVSSLPDDVSWGQPVWARDGSGLVVVGWPHWSPNFPALKKKLGVVFCYNRVARMHFVSVVPAAAAAAEAEAPAAAAPAAGGAATAAPAAAPAPLTFGEPVLLSGALQSAVSPVFTPDGRCLAFLSLDTACSTGTHSATGALLTLPWPQARDGSATPQTVVPVVQQPSQPIPGSKRPFPGLYGTQLSQDLFVGPRTLLLNSQWYSQGAVLAVDLEKGSVSAVSPVDSAGSGSFTALAVAGGRLLATAVAPDSPPRLLASTVEVKDSAVTAAKWSTILSPELPEDAAAALAERVTYKVATVQPVAGTPEAQQHAFESVNWLPKNRTGPCPVILVPHGGPHTSVSTGWFPFYACLAAMGFVVVSPNYRGSTGFGQASLQTLPGNIGTNDVSDCLQALKQAYDSGVADPARASIVGGSHGGFLTGQLTGQNPKTFKAAVLRNPVCNLSLMVGLSDIVDWCFIESYGCEEGMRRASSVPSPADLQAMFDKSPIKHVHKVETPMMFMLGAKDRRVPMQDGLQYIAALRSSPLAPPVRVLTFPEDTHALDKPQTEFEQWINVVWWLRMHGGV